MVKPTKPSSGRDELPTEAMSQQRSRSDACLGNGAAWVMRSLNTDISQYVGMLSLFAAIIGSVLTFVYFQVSFESVEQRQILRSTLWTVFFILGIMQSFWYSSDRRRERFVSICRDKDVQRLTWEAYMNKELVRARPLAHVRIFFKDLAHLFGLVAP